MTEDEYEAFAARAREIEAKCRRPLPEHLQRGPVVVEARSRFEPGSSEGESGQAVSGQQGGAA